MGLHPAEQIEEGIRYLREEKLPTATGKDREIYLSMISKLEKQAQKYRQKWKHPWVKETANF